MKFKLTKLARFRLQLQASKAHLPYNIGGPSMGSKVDAQEIQSLTDSTADQMQKALRSIMVATPIPYSHRDSHKRYHIPTCTYAVFKISFRFSELPSALFLPPTGRE